MDISFTQLSGSVNKILTQISHYSAFNAAVACTAVWTFIRLIRMSRRRNHTTRLGGPPSPSFIYGVGKILLEADDPTSIYESWARAYGTAYEAPSTLGRRRIVLYDPKAIAHFYSKQTWTYVRPPMEQQGVKHLFGRGMFWANGENHRRQRKSLTPALSIAATRRLTPIFYDSAYKTKGSWNALIESSSEDGTIIDVQKWMNHISLDTIGLAGFSHDFEALEGKNASITMVLDSFDSSALSSVINASLFLLGEVFPSLVWVPTARSRLLWKLNTALEEVSNALLARTKKELDMRVIGKEGTSMIGQLVKGAESEFHLSKEEVLSQIKLLLVAAYEATSISMTWALIELSRNPDIQTKLRNELLEHGADPSYDQLANGLPYLDAVVHEILRIHAPIREVARIAVEDDVIPLSEPVRTKSGQLTENLAIAKGTLLIIPMASVNCSQIIWGEDAKVFRPSRWLEDVHAQNGIPTKAKEVQGHRHLLTFADGPRMCLGKHFAIAEFKAVLSVLVKNFVFELRDGPETKIKVGRGFLPRPRVAGEVASEVPLRVKPYVG